MCAIFLPKSKLSGTQLCFSLNGILLTIRIATLMTKGKSLYFPAPWIKQNMSQQKICGRTWYLGDKFGFP